MGSNPIAKKFGWPFIIITSTLACVAPYFNMQIAVVILVASLWAAADNISRNWSVKATGEKEYTEFIKSTVRNSTLSQALFSVYAKTCFLLLMGVVLCILIGSRENLTYWFGFGIIVYATLTAYTSTNGLIRRFNDFEINRKSE